MRIEDPATVKAFRAEHYRCEHCKQVAVLQIHHWYHRGIGDACRIDRRENLLALCQFCHSREESGQILRCSLLALIAQREKLLQPCIDHAIQVILFRLPPRTTLADVRSWHPERQEHYCLITSAGLPTLAGRMCGVEGRVLK